MRHFLEQCLRSVLRATRNIEVEIIVVDNHSTDDSLQMLQEQFGDQILLITNQDNPGFSKANNQGIQISQGKYVLLLNPDTVVEEHTFSKCISFMEKHPEAGALGIYMLDGEGVFLPESKRAIPTPWVSFYKIFGLAALFPRSKTFGQYHLTYLDKNQTHPVEILSGAFMFMRKSALDQVGYLDESFFMYGEDIDLSYRFLKAGYQNYYLSDTRIIHYKGESTKKGSLNYVRVFYQAMLIFADKHFRGRFRKGFTLAIRIAVYLRALIAIANRMTKRFGFPLLELVLVYVVMFGIKSYWEHYVKYIEGQGGQYPSVFEWVYLPAYALIFVFFLWLGGAYRRPFRLRPVFTAPFWAFVVIATSTYLFSFIYNFSRAIVGLSAVFTVLIAFTTRGIINWRTGGNFFFSESKNKRALLAGTPTELDSRWRFIHQQLSYPLDIIGVVPYEGEVTSNLSAYYAGHWGHLEELIQLYQLEEIIFCNKDIPTQMIFDKMVQLSHCNVGFKIIPPQSAFIIGPQNVFHPLQAIQNRSPLHKPYIRRTKRRIDTIGSFLLLALFPILGWGFPYPGRALIQLWQVFTGTNHLVGYINHSNSLPSLKPGLLDISQRFKAGKQPSHYSQNLADTYYADNYSWELDLEILLKGWRQIGRKTLD